LDVPGPRIQQGRPDTIFSLLKNARVQERNRAFFNSLIREA